MDVLLVDDSKTMRMLIQRALRQAGFRNLSIGEAESGVQALDLLSRDTPKLILSDWNMPEMSGIELLKRLRSDNVSIPFGFITSEASPEIKNIATANGARFLITKPFSPESVETALAPFLR